MTAIGQVAAQKWMRAPATRRVIAALEAAGAAPRFVGGCVRDALAGRPVKDIDIATPLAPEAVMEALQSAGIKTVPTGIAHGTVTAVVGRAHFEITTLRVDVETYGRHAKVAFTDDWVADSARRDLTINALSCAPNGTLYDPFGGAEDLRAGRIRFVGDACSRIREDYLRLLRYFRFQAHYGRVPPDPETLSVIEAETEGLQRLSGERVRVELLKLLEAPEPVPVVEVMIARGVLRQVLSGATDASVLRALIRAEGATAPVPLLRLAALLPPGRAAADDAAQRLRLSNKDRDTLRAWAEPERVLGPGLSAHARWRALRALGKAPLDGLHRLEWARRHAGGEALPDAAFEATLAEAEALAAKAFPLRGADALKAGLATGPALGRKLEEAEVWWAEGGFSATRAQCLRHLKQVAAKN